MKKRTVISAILALSVCLIALFSSKSEASLRQAKKPPETVNLSTESKLGAVKFSHLDHITKNRGVDGQQIACVECHHTAQPVSEAVKHPPHKTVWPGDRTTTLTAELIEKDPAVTVDLCTDCHARAETKPKLLPEIPKITSGESTEPIVMTNQQAFHRNCGGCHDAVAKTREMVAPTSKKCLACHKKTAV